MNYIAMVTNHVNALQRVDWAVVGRAAKVIADALHSGKKVMWCGNGGSAAEAQHLSAELVGRYKDTNRNGYASIALSTDTSVLTAVGNDFGFADIFARQVRAIGFYGDVLVVLTTSGTSENIVKAIRQANVTGVKVIALCGVGLWAFEEPKCTEIIKVDSHDAARIQEVHLVIGHAMCEVIEGIISASCPD